MEPKERILERSHELFNKYGIRSVSMDDIASALGMSKKTLYQYYADKDELVNAVIGSVLTDHRCQCTTDQQRAENPIHEVFLAIDMSQEMFAEMNPSILYDMEKYHPTAFKKFKEFKYSFLFGVVKLNLEKGMAEELYRPDLDVDVITRLRIETIMLPFNQDVYPGNRNSLMHIEQQIFEHYLFGIATPKGQKLIVKYKNQRLKK